MIKEAVSDLVPDTFWCQGVAVQNEDACWEREVKHDIKLSGLSNQTPQSKMGTLRKEQVLEGRNHKQVTGGILPRAEPSWGGKTDSKNLRAHLALCSVHKPIVHENVTEKDLYLLEKPEGKYSYTGQRFLNSY